MENKYKKPKLNENKFDLQNDAPRVEYREWRLRPFNYDNTLNAMLTLFVVTTGEGWPGIRQNSMDTIPASNQRDDESRYLFPKKRKMKKNHRKVVQ